MLLLKSTSTEKAMP